MTKGKKRPNRRNGLFDFFSFQIFFDVRLSKENAFAKFYVWDLFHENAI